MKKFSMKELYFVLSLAQWDRDEEKELRQKREILTRPRFRVMTRLCVADDTAWISSFIIIIIITIFIWRPSSLVE